MQTSFFENFANIWTREIFHLYSNFCFSQGMAIPKKLLRHDIITKFLACYLSEVSILSLHGMNIVRWWFWYGNFIHFPENNRIAAFENNTFYLHK